jgi:hypothetical protein
MVSGCTWNDPAAVVIDTVPCLTAAVSVPPVALLAVNDANELCEPRESGTELAL